MVSGIPQSATEYLLPHFSHGTKARVKPRGEGMQCLEHPTTFCIKMSFSAQLPRALCKTGFHPPDAPEPCISSWQEIIDYPELEGTHKDH